MSKLIGIDKRRTKRLPAADDMKSRLAQRIVGQDEAIDAIIPLVQTYQAGLSPDGRPLGVFLLLGPTGTGKTRTVEALAEVLHGSPRNVLRIDCGEYQMEHEVAKLIGAPPGYLGHKETQPVLTQAKLTSVASENCGISIILFDEIEKAAPSMSRLLLGVLDKASLRLGDNNVVNFERCLIFFTSNLGARGMSEELKPSFGFATGDRPDAEVREKLSRIAANAAKRQFAPEFMNRVDAVITYKPLDQDALGQILDQQLRELQTHIYRKLGVNSLQVLISETARQYLLKEGTSSEYGAREIRRTIHKHITQPLAALISEGQIQPRSLIHVISKGESLQFRTSILRVA